MLELPEFARYKLNGECCPQCKAILCEHDVVSAGLHNPHRGGSPLFSINLLCRKCSCNCNLKFFHPGSWLDLAIAIFRCEFPTLIAERKRKRKSLICPSVHEEERITDEEVKKLREAMQRATTNEELLRVLGVTEKDLKKYGQRPMPDGDNGG